MPTVPILTVTNLYKLFGSRTAVNNISFEVGQAEIVGFLGSNGAGKTTTIQMLLSTMTPTRGSITYFGKDFFRHRSEILERVAFASTYVRFPGQLTVYENLSFYAQMFGLSAADRKQSIEKFLRRFDMWLMRNQPAGRLSAGETTRVMLAKAFLARPKVVLLDEPTASLDPDIAHEVRCFVREQQQQEGVSILFTSHNMDEVSEVCDRVLVLQKGSIIANNTPEQLAASVSNAKLHLLLTPGSKEHALDYMSHTGLAYTLVDDQLQIEIDEQAIAGFLTKLSRAEIHYIAISIDKPTLEDYFLHITRKNRV